ncbi:MAG: hypothetical protein HC927_03420 [Deltaproteobacteria bacterium]|nr:hypothetical protein [Deltaproteobacteria bacterium]
MSGNKLAFPEWVMGQVLLPEQFEAQQQARSRTCTRSPGSTSPRTR